MEFEAGDGISFGINLAKFEKPKETLGLCFFDKDGVIVKEKVREDGTFGSPRKIDELEFFENISEIFVRNNQNNIRNIIVTNQPDLQNNLLDLKIFKIMNKIIFSNFKIDCILWCPHNSYYNCLCRKPKVKMFEWAINYFQPLKNNFKFIGDRDSDGEAAKLINAKFFHVIKDIKSCKINEHTHIKTLSDFLDIGL